MPERGFSLLEVMIAVVILAVALTAMLGNLGTLDGAHQANRESAKAQEIAQILAERVQGAKWATLGTVDEPWSWHRRIPRSPADTPANPPLTQSAIRLNAGPLAGYATYAPYAGAVAVVDNLLTIPDPTIPTRRGVGLLREPSGLDDLRVYLEYYRLGATRTAATWRDQRQQFALTDDAARFALLDDELAVVVRIVVTWQARAGGQRSYELFVARRR